MASEEQRGRGRLRGKAAGADRPGEDGRGEGQDFVGLGGVRRLLPGTQIHELKGEREHGAAGGPQSRALASGERPPDGSELVQHSL